MIIQDVKSIEFEQQFLFDFFEEEKIREQKIIADCVEDQTQKSGNLVLADFVRNISESFSLSTSAILQSLFWLAMDLKIHFLIDGVVTKPRQVKRLLLKSLEQVVVIIPNEEVSRKVLERVKEILRKLAADEAAVVGNDQYQLATCLIRKTRHWQNTLKMYQEPSQRDFFPFAKEIAGALNFIKEITTRLDSFSLITAFDDNREAVLLLSDRVVIISNFYTQHMGFWNRVVSSFLEIKDNLPELLDDSDFAAVFIKLEQTLLRPIDSLGDCIAEVDLLHDNITGQCRSMLVTKLDNMIMKIKDLLEAYQAAPAMNAKTLYSLRTFKTNINRSADVPAMVTAFIDAEIKFDDFKDEIKDTSFKSHNKTYRNRYILI